jgi:hypothetical protein
VPIGEQECGNEHQRSERERDDDRRAAVGLHPCVAQSDDGHRVWHGARDEDHEQCRHVFVSGAVDTSNERAQDDDAGQRDDTDAEADRQGDASLTDQVSSAITFDQQDLADDLHGDDDD